MGWKFSLNPIQNIQNTLGTISGKDDIVQAGRDAAAAQIAATDKANALEQQRYEQSQMQQLPQVLQWQYEMLGITPDQNTTYTTLTNAQKAQLAPTLQAMGFNIPQQPQQQGILAGNRQTHPTGRPMINVTPQNQQQGMLQQSQPMTLTERYLQTPGAQFTLDQGNRNINARYGQSGFLSGAVDKDLMNYGQGAAQQYYQSYLDRLANPNTVGSQQAQNTFNLGTNQGNRLFGGYGAAAGTQASAYMAGQNAQNQMMGQLIGAGAQMASDRRLKKNIAKIGNVNGINVYEFEYLDKLKTPGKYQGVMAQEILETHPEAVSKRDDGYYQVDYSKLPITFKRFV